TAEGVLQRMRMDRCKKGEDEEKAGEQGWSVGVLECWSVGVLECWSEVTESFDGTRSLIVIRQVL
ncbi:MAG: hypothetical protein QGG53_45840, partial [Planctomycetota bacterium]|nr:hypothetical protein [Planctomycetota bacterium]